MTKRNNIIAEAISSIGRNISRSKADQAKLRTHRAAISALVRRTAKKSLAELHLSTWVSVSDDYSSERKVTETIFSIGIAANNLPGFKDKKLILLLSQFLDADKDETKDWPASLNRDYIFWFRQPEPNTWIRVCIYAYVKSDSPTCRKVLTRVESETVSREVYEIVCD